MQDEVRNMRIDFQYTPPAPSEGTGSAQNNAVANRSIAGGAQAVSAQAESTPGEDQASLSGAHVQIAALSAQASQLPEVREQRVQALRQAVESGQYRAEPQQVAGALVTHMIQNLAA
jgi:flagellar biosynthesis anti-sigma factor FlgM